MKASRGTSNIYKQKALQVMKRRKLYEQQLETLMGQQMNLEQAQFAQDSIQDTINSVNAMQQAYNVQKKMMKQINLNHVEKVMDDMSDLQMDTDEINEIMSRNYALEGLDEDELEEELMGLDAEMLEDNLNRDSISVPSYMPTQSYKSEEAKMEEELPSVPS